MGFRSLLGARRVGSLQPVVVAAGRDAQHAASQEARASAVRVSQAAQNVESLNEALTALLKEHSAELAAVERATADLEKAQAALSVALNSRATDRAREVEDARGPLPGQVVIKLKAQRK